MSSRFLNSLVRNLNPYCQPYNVHRLNPANLFYPTISPEPKVSAYSPKIEDVPLPPARLNIAWPCLRLGDFGSLDFMAFGRIGEKIISVDHHGCIFLYDFASRALHARMPVPPKRILDPVTFAVGDDLYAFGRAAGSGFSFMALIDGASAGLKANWYWKSLHLPSFACSDDDPSCSDEDDIQRIINPFQIVAYTVVGDSQILISIKGDGTYSFDMASGAWSKAWEWVLPFRGGAEYVPEHNLWFGISNKDQQLCASDLTALSELPPVAHNFGKDLVAPPKDCTLRKTKLLPLGGGKLCIARFFRTLEEVGPYELDMPEYFVVLTGVEVVHDSNGKGLQMIRHKSNRYSFGNNLADPL